MVYFQNREKFNHMHNTYKTQLTHLMMGKGGWNCVYNN